MLFQRHRDAYCPRCFKEDVERRAVYTRRRWIDSWCLQCEVHGCLLGAYVHPPSGRNEKLLPNPLPVSEQLRLGTTRLGTVLVFDPRLHFWGETSAIKRKPSRPRWLDPPVDVAFTLGAQLDAPLRFDRRRACGEGRTQQLWAQGAPTLARRPPKGDRLARRAKSLVHNPDESARRLHRCGLLAGH